MKTSGPSLLSATAILLASFSLQPGSFAAQDQPAEIQIQGRPLSTWAAELGYGEREGSEQAIAVLVSAGPKIVTNLADLLLHSTSSREQAGAVLAIRAIAYQNPAAAPALPAAIPALASAVDNHDPGVRVLAIQGLGAAGKTASNTVPLLLRLTKDADYSVRMCAVESLGRIGIPAPQTVAAIQSCMSDTSGDVGISSVKALYTLGQPPSNAIPVLVRLTRAENSGVRCCAVEMLGQVGTNSLEAIAALKSALSDESASFVARKALKSLNAN